MCGIAGIVDPTGRRLASIDDMVPSLGHRGPDDEGVFRTGSVALGHRRLSIIDIAGGQQPMLDESGELAIVFNGEIYNFPELRRHLRDRGHGFRTESDTEVVLECYRAFGDDCVLHLDGMFAFGLWDVRRERLLLARDHMGQKPVFYVRLSDSILFASEIKSLLAAGVVTPELDAEALYHYSSLRFIPDDMTLFQNVKKLPAGHRLVFEDGDVAVSRYWSLSIDTNPDLELEDAVDELDRVLNETVESHLIADVPVGTFLSGGIDSSLFTALAARHVEGPLPTFSIGVEEQSFNELPYARMVAEQYGTDHHEEVVRADLVERLPEMVYHLEEPADPFGVGVYLASEVASRHVKVVLSGDGGDELFAGYDRFAGQRLAELHGYLPGFVRRRLLKPLFDRVPESFEYKSLAQKLRWVNEMSFLDGGSRYARSMSFLRFGEEDKRRLFTERVLGSLEGIESREKILALFGAPGGSATQVDRMLYTDLTSRIPDHLLPIVDRMSMAYGLEVRAPFMEHRFVEFAMSLPGDLKLRRMKLKYLLRRVAERYLPSELVYREKQGFGFPLGQWYRDDLRPLVEALPAQSALIRAGIFRQPFVEELLRQHLDGDRDHSYRIWILISLEVWWKLFIEGATPEDTRLWLRDTAAGKRTAVSMAVGSRTA